MLHRGAQHANLQPTYDQKIPAGRAAVVVELPAPEGALDLVVTHLAVVAGADGDGQHVVPEPGMALARLQSTCHRQAAVKVRLLVGDSLQLAAEPACDDCNLVPQRTLAQSHSLVCPDVGPVGMQVPQGQAV